MRRSAFTVALAVVTGFWLFGNPGWVCASPGTGILHGTDASAANLLVVGQGTGAGSIVGSLGGGVFPALAVYPTTGIMYAGQGAGSPKLYTVNPSNGAATLVGDTGLGFAAFGDMDFRADGTLFAASWPAPPSSVGS